MKSELLRVENLSLKTEVGYRLKYMNLNLFKGELLAITGFFGSGKSTFARCMSGFYPEAQCRIHLEERRIFIRSIQQSQDYGIFYINKTPMLVPELSVSENIFAIRNHSFKNVIYNRRASIIQSEALLHEIDLNIPGNRRVSELSQAEMHLLQIVKVAAMGAKVIILDEITGDYDPTEMLRLEKTIRCFPHISFIYIGDITDNILQRADRVMVMRGGRTAGTLYKEEVNREKLITLSRGHSIDETMKRKSCKSEFEAFRIISTSLRTLHKPLSVYSGEITGILDLTGDRRGMLIEEITNEKKQQMWIGQKLCTDYYQAVEEGLALIGRNIGPSSLFACFDLRENLTFQVLRKISKFGIISTKLKEYVFKESYKKNLLPLDNPYTKWHTLQVLLAKWISSQPKVIILDNIMSEMDLIAKRHIFYLLNELAQNGTGILYLSTDWSDCYNLCDRILILNNQGYVTQIDTTQTDSDHFMDLCSLYSGLAADGLPLEPG